MFGNLAILRKSSSGDKWGTVFSIHFPCLIKPNMVKIYTFFKKLGGRHSLGAHGSYAFY